MRLPALALALCRLVDASVTVYQQAQATMVASSGAHNTTTLTPPALPDPKPATSYFIQLQTGGTPGVSMTLPSAFLGFSVEMSVANQVLGHNSTLLQVPFLNLMQNIVQRAGAVHVRVGGNTQDFATLIPTLGDGTILYKDKSALQSNNPTATPPMYLAYDFLYVLANISTFTNVHWFLGVPFNDTNFRMEIVSKGEEILGSYLEGFQAANEPDFYVAHGHRDAGWGPSDYIAELKQLVALMDADSQYATAKTQLIVPSIASSNDWTTQQLYDLGIVDNFTANVKYLSVEKYPEDNCAAIYDTGGTVVNPQDVFKDYTSHTLPASLASRYASDTAYAQTKGKPFIMFETNTASCGGFPGVSDSFGAALWGLDYAMSMAYYNFSGALFHLGGQNVYYNPFTAAPTNETFFHQWTIGPMYYSALVMAEVLGDQNKSQVLDLNANSGAATTPAYAVFENGEPTKLALFNYMDDSTGASNLTVTFAVGGSGVNQANASPGTVKVKYLRSNSVSDKGNFTWAGQTFGDAYSSDGRPTGTEDIRTVTCNTDNTCAVTVPAPGFALVFLNSDITTESEVKTYSTTAYTKTRNTATIDPSVLATSNGHQNVADKKYSTSVGSAQNVGQRHHVSWGVVLLSVCLGAFGVGLRR
ncbi:glycoside hydrolase family 79 protein [Flagelloscypha sp. PMI_526]|nr:glycoside hydrolase family 79 protein [Flagelloscypha sp. PMI_526]